MPAGEQYVDVGTNIDTNDERLADRMLSLRVDVESSSALKSDTAASTQSVIRDNAANHLPLIRRTTWGSQVVIPLDKPPIIFTADNVSDTGKTELELTATPIKEP